MRKLASFGLALAVFGLGQSVSGWQSPDIGVALMGAFALVGWLRPRWSPVDRYCSYLGIATSSDASEPAMVPDAHRDFLRRRAASIYQTVLQHGPVAFESPEAAASFAAHFPEFTETLDEWHDALDRETAAMTALRKRLMAECVSRGMDQPRHEAAAIVDLLAKDLHQDALDGTLDRAREVRWCSRNDPPHDDGSAEMIELTCMLAWD